MASIHPKGQAYFQNLMNKPGGTTPKPRREVEVVEPITGLILFLKALVLTSKEK